MKVLIDTNIILDYMLNRKPHVEQSAEIIKLCAKGELAGSIAIHTITTSLYFLQKNLSIDETKSALRNLCSVFTVIGVDISKIKQMLADEGFNDLEDCLQHICAVDFGAKYIVTRNIKDFKTSKVKAVTPAEFLEIIEKEGI